MADPVSYLDLVESHGGGDRPLLVLTDEELAAVSGDLPDARNAVDLQALDGLTEDQLTAVMAAALRSLAARQLLSDAEDGDPSRVMLHDQLAIVTGARTDAVGITVAERQTDEGPRTFAVYALADGAALLDQAERGVHVLHLVTAGEALTALATFLDPEEGADESRDGEVLEGDAAAPPDGWSDIVVAAGEQAATLVSTTDEGTSALAVFPTGAQLWLVGSLEEDDEGTTTRVRATQLGPTSLLSLLAATSRLVLQEDDRSA